MKKCVFLMIALCVISVSSVSAQAVFGVRVGVSRPTMTDGDESFDGVFGLELGPVLYYSLPNNWYINSGLMFSMKNFKDSYSDSWGSYEDKATLNYLEVPLYAGYRIPIGQLFTYIQAGPYFGYNLSAKQKYEESYNGGYESGTEDIKDYINDFNAGLGIMYGIDLNRFKIELGYQFGLIDFVPESGVKIRSLFLGVSYVF